MQPEPVSLTDRYHTAAAIWPLVHDGSAKSQLANLSVPCLVTAGTDTGDPSSPIFYLHEGARWLAQQLGTALVEVPGGHVPQLTHPREYVDVLRSVLEKAH